jgi:hypothetical protein
VVFRPHEYAVAYLGNSGLNRVTTQHQIMRKKISTSLCSQILAGSAVLALTTGSASAIITDGFRDAGYGAALSVQTVQTQFGDNASELNAAYASIVGGNLHLLLTGNLENNYNKLNIFIDSKVVGQNQIIGASNPANDGWAAKYNGFRFDNAFSADYLFIMRRGGGGFDLDYTVVGGGATGFDNYGNVFGGPNFGAATTALGANLGFSFGVAYDGSNIGGVTGGTGAADQTAAQAVTTGIELMIPLAALGNPGAGDTIRVSAMVNGSNHDYLSNQMLGGLPAGQGNLGGDGAGGYNGTVGQLDMNNFAGNQYFVIAVPEPSSLSLAGLGLAALFLRRKK